MKLSAVPRSKRALSLVTDIGITSVGLVMLYGLIILIDRRTSMSAGDLLDWLFMIGLVFHAAYLTHCYHHTGQTLGSRIYHIRVLSPDGERLSLWYSFLRATNVTFMPMIVGLMCLGKNRNIRHSKAMYSKLQTSLWDVIAHSITVIDTTRS
jgi:uncharacterized RDD family membrane protein YckC